MGHAARSQWDGVTWSPLRRELRTAVLRSHGVDLGRLNVETYCISVRALGGASCLGVGMAKRPVAMIHLSAIPPGR